MLHICCCCCLICVNCFAELLRARGAKLKTLTLMLNSSSQEGLGVGGERRRGAFVFLVLRGKLLLQKNIINLDHCVLFVLISCYYSHNRSTSEEGNVKKSCFKFYYTSIQMLYNYRKRYRM